MPFPASLDPHFKSCNPALSDRPYASFSNIRSNAVCVGAPQRLEFDTDLQRIQRQRTPDCKVIQSVEDEGMWNTLLQAGLGVPPSLPSSSFVSAASEVPEFFFLETFGLAQSFEKGYLLAVGTDPMPRGGHEDRHVYRWDALRV